MKKSPQNDDFIKDNQKYIQNTLARSKTLSASVNTYMLKNNIKNIDNNDDKQKYFPANTQIAPNNKIPQNKKINFQEKFRKKSENDKNSQIDEDEDEDDDQNDIEEDEGIYTYDYVCKQIEKYQKQVNKFDGLVKKNLELSKRHPNKKDEYKDEAIRALKKKKFYNKAMDRFEQRKIKIELKNLDKEFKIQKKELKKLTREFKRKVALVSLGKEYDDYEGGDDSSGSEDSNDHIFAQVDLDDNSLNMQYDQIISQQDVINASENLNLFKFIFQDE